MVFQNYALFPHMTVAENLTFPLKVRKMSQSEIDEKVSRELDMVQMRTFSDRKPAQLSGGQQQMLALARVMLHEPDVLIIDELSLGLAPTVVQDLLSHIDTLRAAGQTMIIVEQSLNVALAIADRAVFLEKGQVRFEGDAQELAERDDLARAVFRGKEGG